MLGERKLGGILCEARWQGDALAWVVVGLGLNVTNPVPQALRGVAANLKERLPDISAASLAEPMAAAVRAAAAESARLTPAELDLFAGLDWLRGRRLKSPAAGVAAGIAADGSLRVATDSGHERPVRTGPVELADSSAPT
jgi:biotin-(acetyl-CoA carboxylase) ligase